MYLALRLMSLTLIVAIKIAGAIHPNGRGRDKEDDPHQVIVEVVVTDSNNQPVKGLGFWLLTNAGRG